MKCRWFEPLDGSALFIIIYKAMLYIYGPFKNYLIKSRSTNFYKIHFIGTVHGRSTHERRFGGGRGDKFTSHLISFASLGGNFPPSHPRPRSINNS